MKRSQQPVRLELVPSRYLAIYIILLHSSVLFLMPFIPAQSTIVWILASVVLLSFGFNWRIHISFKGNRATQRVEWMPDGKWILTDGLKTSFQAELLSGSYVSPWLLVLRFKVSRFRGRSIILFSDSAEKNGLRRLRVQLKRYSGL